MLLLHLIFHVLGIDNVSGPWYAWWSGPAGDLSELTLLAGIAHLYRIHNCEVQRCWRVGRHTTNGGHRVCRRHHPDGVPTHEDVIAAHTAAS